ncbi:hypothetical protein D9M72_653800 [compost metagenome]
MASTASASLRSISCLWPGVTCFQDLNASLAAVMAASTSACTEMGDLATTSPFAGFTISSSPVPAGVTNSPLMKFCKVWTTVFNLFHAGFWNRFCNRRSIATAHEPMPGQVGRE